MPHHHYNCIPRERWRHGLLALALLCATLPALAQNPAAVELWQSLDSLPPNRVAADIRIQPERFRAFQLNAAALRDRLNRAPGESAPQAATAPTEISLPMPDGALARFTLAESPVMAPELAAKFPEIKTYCGRGLDDPQATVRFDWTPAGFHAQILSPRGAVYIDPPLRGNSTLHVSYFKRDYRRDADGFFCLTAADDPPGGRAAVLEAASLISGGTLRTYRLACAATGEYTVFHGGTVASGLAAIVTAINRITGVYETELGIRLALVANNNLIVYTDGGTDPYTDADGLAMLAQNQSNLDAVIGSANYDIGHVFSTGGGGVASRGVVCSSTLKARGVTGLPAPVGDAFWIDFVAHEMGHQFGANHTFNSSTGNCNGTRFASDAFEPGSGSTLMAYAGICTTDNLQLHSDAYFHSISLQEINAYITTGGGGGCPVATATANSPPAVSAGASYTIPRNTPFTLTATGSDPDGHPLTYCWEERDLGPTQAGSEPDNGSSPIFRSFPPVSSPARTFPKLPDILNNTTSFGEKLPSTTRTMNFRVTARDNRPAGGGFATADMQVTADFNSGPFTVTAPNTAGTRSGAQTVTWNVAGTTNSPVNAPAVNILLSTNGGNTFPITLLTNTPNVGSATVTLPNLSTPAARIKVEAAANIFFDVSEANFTIVPATPLPLMQLDSTALLTENCSPPNGVLDPNETVTVNFALKNVGTGNTTNLVATLLPTGGVAAPGGPQTYGVVQSLGPSVTRPFLFTATGGCGGAVTATLQLQDGSMNLGAVTATFVLGRPVPAVTSFSNTNRIAIPASGNSGAASPYPSSINVSNLAGVVTKVAVTLSNLAHATADDIDVLLVGPTGQAMILLSDSGGTSTAITNVSLTFDDSASITVPNSTALMSGTFHPTNYGSGDTFSAPAPTGPYASTLSTFNGLLPNGVWSLYIVDDASNGNGSLVNGWRLALTTSGHVCCNRLPPVVSSIAPQFVDEDTPTPPIAFTVASAETPAGALILAAVSSNTNLVPGANIVFGGGGSNRTVTLMPAPNQSGATLITLKVTDASSNLASTAFLLTVNSVNDAPVLSVIADRIIHLGATLIVTNTATDVDVPANQLTFSLGNAPPNASINAMNGIFTWTPDPGRLDTTNTVTVRVADNGTPHLEDARTFQVAVVSPPVIASVSVSGGAVTLAWSAVAGTTYRIQYKPSLGDAGWNDVPDDVRATEATATKVDNPGPAAQRFYRVTLAP